MWCSYVTPWTVAHQPPLSMDFSRQEYWSGLPFPSPGDLLNPGIEPRSPTLQVDSLPTGLSGKPFIQPQKEWNIATCSNIDRPRKNYTYWSKSNRKRQILYDITYMWNQKKNTTNKLIYKTETDSQTKKTNLYLPKGKEVRDRLRVWD